MNPSWHDLYTGILGFTKIQGFDAGNYSFVNNAPVAAYFVKIVDQELQFFKNYSHLPQKANFFNYCFNTQLSSTQHLLPNRKYFSLQNTVMTPELLNYFFKEKTNALSLFTDNERGIVQQYYPFENYGPLILNGALMNSNRSNTNRFVSRILAQVLPSQSTQGGAVVSVLDFSIRGLKIESQVEIPENMELRLSIGPFEIAEVKAQLRRRNGNHYGLEIISGDEAWTSFVNAMLGAFAPSPTHIPADELLQRRQDRARRHLMAENNEDATQARSSMNEMLPKLRIK